MVVLHGQVNPLKEASRISRFRGDRCLRHKEGFSVEAM
jgi:hypothetical protein